MSISIIVIMREWHHFVFVDHRNFLIFSECYLFFYTFLTARKRHRPQRSAPSPPQGKVQEKEGTFQSPHLFCDTNLRLIILTTKFSVVFLPFHPLFILFPVSFIYIMCEKQHFRHQRTCHYTTSAPMKSSAVHTHPSLPATAQSLPSNPLHSSPANAFFLFPCLQK